MNVLILLLRKSYDVHVGPLHLVADGLFKPLLILNGAFLLFCFVPEPVRTGADTARLAEREDAAYRLGRPGRSGFRPVRHSEPA